MSRQFPVAAVRSGGDDAGVNASELARSAASDAAPPAGLPTSLRALWLVRAGQWDAAHDLCQEISGTAGSWIHAYLHREEGDHSNAAYWYSRAGKPVPAKTLPLEDEWLAITAALSGGN